MSTGRENGALGVLHTCWSCRVLSGGGVILAGLYVLNAARNVIRRSGHTSMGTAAQITFGAGEGGGRDVTDALGVTL